MRRFGIPKKTPAFVKLGFPSYQAFLASATWKKRRARFYKDHPDRFCALCDGQNLPLEIHHLSYNRLGHERDEDLAFLCRSCHDSFHFAQRHLHGWRPQRIMKYLKGNQGMLALVASRRRIPTHSLCGT